MQIIDGSEGEGGGQVLRTSLALSAVTGEPVTVERIRARRSKPGLRQQHLTAVLALQMLCDAEVRGASIGSSRVVFRPRAPRPGPYHFSIGTAGSASLVLQAVLPPLLAAGGRSDLVLEGGTHNMMAPPFDFLEGAFFPVLRAMGVGVRARLERAGFYPVGGGRFRVELEPPRRLVDLRTVELVKRGQPRHFEARAIVARLPDHIAERELAVVKRELGWPDAALEVVRRDDSPGPGNALVLSLAFEHVAEVVTGFGRRGLPAETVAKRAVAEAQEYLERDVPVGAHLADQLLLPLALAGDGRFRTLPLTSHSRTHIALIERMLPVHFAIDEEPSGCVAVSVAARHGVVT